jgi:aromatic-L-amino-acid decarboxylase
MQSDPAANHRPPHMTPDEFRELGHRMVDWIADYLRTIESRPVRGPVRPGDVLRALPGSPPESPGHPGEWDAIFRDLDAIIAPNLTHWQHPSFFAYFPCNASGPGILGELASAGLGVNGMLWATSPAATELETRVLDWCRELFDLPAHFAGNGVIQGTASEATLVALLAARRHRRAADPGARSFAVLCSEQAHSSVAKAAMIAGLADSPEDRSAIRLIPTTPDLAMDPEGLRAELGSLRDDPGGRRAALVVATLGTTATGAIDPVDAIARTIRETDPATRLHIDAAYTGSALVCPEFRALARGIEHADSICINPHKWLLTNFDCDLFWIRDRRPMIDALSITPEYLRNAASDAGAVIDYRDWQIPLGRRFRALKLWFVIRHYGAEGLRAHIRRHVAWADWFAQRAGADPRFEVVARSPGLVCFRLRGDDDANRALLERVNAGGEILLSHAVAPAYDGTGRRSGSRYILRFALGAPATAFAHVARAWEVIARG